jgi:hypothetical protein
MPLIKRFLKRLYSFIPFKKEIFSFIRPLGIPERIYRHLHFKDTFRVKVDSKHSFKVHHIGAKVENENLLGWSIRLMGETFNEDLDALMQKCKLYI